MVFIVSDEVERYAEEHTTAPPEHLIRLANETRASLECPQMLTGPIEGRLLQMLVFATRARRVLEIGTYSGYSALAMAEALPSDGRIVTCEVSEVHAAFARTHIQATRYAKMIDIRVGPALETIGTLGGRFDFIFVDADKQDYTDYYEATLPLLADHGLMAVDNTLWHGRVADPGSNGRTTAAVRRFNDRVRADQRVVCVQLTVRDGVTLIRRAN
jgi:caffeoyl-CoA O-methyltransferase